MRRRSASIAAAATALALSGVGFAAPAVAGASTPSPSAAACDKTPWAAPVQGAPAGFGAGSPSGDYLWHDAQGFHLRVTHGGTHDRRIYSGEITASAPMRMDRVRLEKGDVAKLSANHRTIVFVFSNHGYIDGVNFHTDCASTVTVSRLHIGSSNLGAGRVYLGAHRTHPASVPFTLHRVPTTAT